MMALAEYGFIAAALASLDAKLALALPAGSSKASACMVVTLPQFCARPGHDITKTKPGFSDEAAQRHDQTELAVFEKHTDLGPVGLVLGIAIISLRGAIV